MAKNLESLKAESIRLKYEWEKECVPCNASLELINKLDDYCVSNNLDFIIFPCGDEHLSEYNPLSNNMRYGVTGFTGSAGDALYVSKKIRDFSNCKPVLLFVDGRYYIQADKEVDDNFVQVEKPALDMMGKASFAKVLEYKGSLSTAVVGVFYTRETYVRGESWAEMSCGSIVFKELDSNFMLNLLGLKLFNVDRDIEILSSEVNGRSFTLNLENLKKRGLAQTNYCFFTCRTDDAAWLLNGRGFHSSRVSGIRVWCFVVNDELLIYMPDGSKNCAVNDRGFLGNYKIIRGDFNSLKEELSKYKVSNIYFHKGVMTASLPKELLNIWPSAEAITDFMGLRDARCQKNEQEIQLIKEVFLDASRAIASTLKSAILESESYPAEESLALLAKKNYIENGAVELSFNTIAARGENSALAHYNGSESEKKWVGGELFLLDSGMYKEEGYATDCTRVVFNMNDAKNEQIEFAKKAYTVVLKSMIAPFIRGFNFPVVGRDFDAMCREKLQAYGMDYGHGTGHAIGSEVHEWGPGAGPNSQGYLLENMAISIEPGYYVEGKGGVRIENCAIIRKSGSTGYLENLIYVGFDWRIIDLTLLTEQEKEWLRDYELKCREFGTAVTDSPLL